MKYYDMKWLQFQDQRWCGSLKMYHFLPAFHHCFSAMKKEKKGEGFPPTPLAHSDALWVQV